jgi:uncharacterized membrane protein
MTSQPSLADLSGQTVIQTWGPLLFIALAMPMILGLVPRNWIYGTRTRRTLSSDDVWYPVNRVAGWLLLVVGVIWSWLGPLSVPGWALVAFVLALFLICIAISVKRIRAESRLMQTLWKALTGR